jgi:hypothetical protein
MNYLYGLPISRRLGEARDAIRSPAGQTPAQIAQHLMILDWHGDDADQLRANDFRRDHGLPDQISMNPELAPVIDALNSSPAPAPRPVCGLLARFLGRFAGRFYSAGRGPDRKAKS